MLPQAKVETFVAVREKLSKGNMDLASWYCGHLAKRSEIDSLVEGICRFGVKTVSGSAERDLLDEIDHACESGGFGFGIHNHYFHNRKFIYESPEDMLSALDWRPHVFATLDTGQMIAVGVDPTEAYRKLRPHVRIIHLKRRRQTRPQRCVRQRQRFLRTITDDGFRGFGGH